LDEEADLMEAMGAGVASSPSPEKGGDPNDIGGTMRIKAKKNKMCTFIAEKKKCPAGKKCQYAHNPIELDLISSETRMKNLNGVILS
jgi:hypothetical protein